MPRATFPSGRKLLFLLLALVTAGIGGAWWWVSPPAEPVHDGQRLSEWLSPSYTSMSLSALLARQDRDRAPDAPARRVSELRAFGPAAVPWLAYWVEHDSIDPATARLSMRRRPLPFDRAPAWLRRIIPIKWGGLRVPLRVRRDQAADALALLGPDAAPAIPALARTLEGKGQAPFYNIACVLHAIGPASWPVIQHALAHASQPARTGLLSSLPLRMGSDAQPPPDTETAQVFDVLVKACRDPDAAVRYIAVDALAACHRKRPSLIPPDSAIPEIIPLLSDAEHSVRAPAAEVVGLFGTKADSAIPRLIELLDDENARVRDRAAWALARVDLAGKRSAARLRVMTHDSDPNCREAAARALEALSASQPAASASEASLPAR